MPNSMIKRVLIQELILASCKVDEGLFVILVEGIAHFIMMERNIYTPMCLSLFN